MKKQLYLLGIIIGLLAYSQAHGQASGPYEWNNVAIGGGGFVSGVFFSPIEQNVIYARTDVGGAYRWHETSQSWISMLDWVDTKERGLLGVEALAIDPTTPGTVYLMTGTIYWNQADDGIGRSAFLRSSDYGQTWEKIPVWDNSTKYFNVHGNGMGRGNGERLAIDPANSNTMFYGTRNKGLWKSSNNGSSWSKVSSFPVDTTWNGCGISFVAFDPSTTGPSQTARIYVGVLRKTDNLFVSEDAGATWTLIPDRPYPQYAADLMPQRVVIPPDGSKIITTWGNGAGPHTMQWDESWGPINDWFNRGAVFEYDVVTQTWTDISPEDLIDPEGDGDPSDPSTYYGCYSGVSIDPNNPDHMVVSSIASYRGPQFWKVDGTWYDEWGDNIFVTEDGGDTWVPSFRYYWMDGGYYPDAEQMNENGVPWMVRNTIHWIGSTAIDPFRPQRVFVTSGNGVFKTENIFNYTWSDATKTTYTQYTVWEVASHGIEEVVPEDLVSIPGGPLVSVIGDYDGFVHDDITTSPMGGQHKVSASGETYHLGSTTGLAYAPQNGKLVKCAKTREIKAQYSTIPIGPVQWSSDNGVTWTTETYTSNPPADLKGGKVAVSADGVATLWMPSEGTVMYRHTNSQWDEVDGISFNGRPVGDQVNEDQFYVFDNSSGYMMVSTDKGTSFSQAGYAGTSNFRNAVAVPGNAGHVWVPLASYDGTGGLMRSSDGGATFSAVPGVGYCEAVGFGKAAEGADYPTVFVFAEVGGITGLWRSVNQGASWVQINDADHEYGGLANGEFVVGDMNVFGRVYMSTAGRGIAYGDPSGDPIPVTGVAISPSQATVSIGTTLGLDVIITPSNASNQSVSWNSDDTGIATVGSFGLVSGISAGTVTITATTLDGGFSATAQVTVEENANTNPVAAIAASPTNGVAPLTVDFSASGSSDADGDVLSYSWTFGDGTSATGETTSHTYTSSGIYTATVMVSDNNGGNGTASINITVTGPETTTYELTTSTIGPGSISLDPAGNIYEEGTVVTATALASSGYLFVSWSGDVVGTSESITITMDADKSITATFEVGDDGETPCINPTTVSTPFAKDGAGEFCFVTSGEISYVNSWNMDLVEINGEDYSNTWSNSLPPKINGNYYIHYIGQYPWSHFEAAGPQNRLINTIPAYPNPFKESVKLKLQNHESIISIQVVDQTGHIVQRYLQNEVLPEFEFGSGLSSGLYYVLLVSDSKVQTLVIRKL